MNSLKLEGIFPAFATPTASDDGDVDLPGLRKLLEYLIDNGACGLVPVGGTGEFTAMSPAARLQVVRSEEHTSELQSLMRISYAVFCLKTKNVITQLLLLTL